MRSLPVLALVAGLSLASAGVALAQPSGAVVEICAKTNLPAVDSVLDGLATSQLVGALAPLATLTVPDGTGTKLAVDVDLNEVRTALGCTPPITLPTTTPSATPTPSTTAPVPTTPGDIPPLYADCDAVRDAGMAPLLDTEDGYRTALDSDGDGIACESNDFDDVADNAPVVLPRGGVDTGWM